MTPPSDAAVIDRLTAHPLREDLYGELHARPTRLVDVPLRASHVAFLATPDEIDESREHVARLARRYTTTAPQEDASFYYGRFGGFELRWEKHTEFFSVTVTRDGVDQHPFEDTAFSLLPEGWAAAIPGCLVVATHAAMLGSDTPMPDIQQLRSWFEGQLIVGSSITDDRAACWTTFRMHRDGFSRYLVRDNGLSAFQAGRTLQRLLELETYRVLCLMALPVARKLASETTRLDGELASIMDRFMAIRTPQDEQALLEELSRLAALVERHRSTTNYRFGATRAYSSLVNEILEDLREERFQGMSSMAKFLERRLGPGVRTCLAMEDRLEGLSQRVGRASDLLQARINVSIETQNQGLLTAMNRRSGLQLRLQQTVEGLSVAAISYYTVALLQILFESLEESGAPIRSEIATGIALPVVVIGVWMLVRRVRRHITSDDPGDAGPPEAGE